MESTFEVNLAALEGVHSLITICMVVRMNKTQTAEFIFKNDNIAAEIAKREWTIIEGMSDPFLFQRHKIRLAQLEKDEGLKTKMSDFQSQLNKTNCFLEIMRKANLQRATPVAEAEIPVDTELNTILSNRYTADECGRQTHFVGRKIQVKDFTKATEEELRIITELIRACMTTCMTETQTADYLSSFALIDPQFTKAAWEKMMRGSDMEFCEFYQLLLRMYQSNAQLKTRVSNNRILLRPYFRYQLARWFELQQNAPTSSASTSTSNSASTSTSEATEQQRWGELFFKFWEARTDLLATQGSKDVSEDDLNSLISTLLQSESEGDGDVESEGEGDDPEVKYYFNFDTYYANDNDAPPQ